MPKTVIDTFVHNQINGLALLQLTEADLKDMLSAQAGMNEDPKIILHSMATDREIERTFDFDDLTSRE